MIYRLKYLLLTILLLAASSVAGQYSVDKVCMGTERYYRVTGEANATYTWQLTDPAGTVFIQLSDRDTVGIIWNTAPGVYQLSVVQHGENNCDANIELGTVEVFEQPVAFAGNPITQCSGSPVSLSGATAGYYAGLAWISSGDGSFDNNSIIQPVYTPGINDMIAGNVILTLTASGMGNSGSCVPAVSSISISLSAIVSSAVSTPASCSGTADGTATLTASGGTVPYNFVLDGMANTSGIFTNLAAGTYSYTITDAISCETSGTVMVGTAAALLATPEPIPVNCFGVANGGIQVSEASGGSGSYEYSIDNINWQISILFTGLAAGTYTVYLRDATVPTCVVTAGIVTVSEPAVLYAESIHTNVSLPGANDGTITVISQTGGSGAYEYSIDGINWQATVLFANLPAGTYSVFIRDAAATDCFTGIGDEIVLDGLYVSTTSVDVSCFGYSDGQVIANATGGTEPYIYLWNDPAAQTTAVASGLPAGIYTVIVTDFAGNTASDTDTITQPEQVIPAFGTIGPLCLYSIAPSLPAISVNGISGTWSPAEINTTVAGTSTYTFTPDAGQCSTTAILEISISDQSIPVFDPIAPLCQYSIPPELLSVSLNGINGSWNPALINTSVAGTLTYTFTPDAGVCATTITLDITIDPQIIPEFDPIGPLCINSTAPELSTVSLNGINGIWNPPTINTAVAGTSTYTFKPFIGLCAAIFSFDITITGQLLPEFNPIGPLCINSTAPALPGTSVNGIPGTWVPDIITTAFAGTTTYVFTPAEGQCAISTSLPIEVTAEILPLFAAVGPLCINSTPPALPLVSANGLTGSWLPAVISTTTAGTAPYIFTPDTGQCAIPAILNITIATEIMPVFTAIGPLCQNSVPPLLPAASANGITGIWEPATISTTDIGTFMYIFTPDTGQCAMAVSLAIQITYPILPSFESIGPLCQNSTPPFLPNTSLNGITGNWSPDVISTSLTGTSTYFFTPDQGQCAVNTSLDITINETITPQFAAIGPLCQDAVPPALPPTSENGISGTWYPQTINTALPGTSVYTFTPDEGQCAPAVSLEIEISNSIVPVFASIGPLCQNETPPALPATSENGISGTWTPPAINTSLLGTSVYTFTPDEGECALVVTMDIEISNSIVPVFATLPPLCQFATPPALPATSENGITGTWNPSTINTALLGTSVYTFTPDNGQCALPVTIEIVISNSIVPVFPAIGPLCLNETPPALPSTSGNGISGSWNPQAISTSVTGTSSFIFTPDAGQCAATATLEIVILNKLNPLFATIGPLCPNSPAPALPSASVNGITGTWVPAAISTALPGITDYIFTPDAGQCAVSGMLSIEVGGPLIIEIQAFTSTNGLANGHAKIIVSGTALPFTYSHNGTDWQVQDEFTGLIAGTYTAWVMDANGCQAAQQFVIPNTVTGEVGVLAGNVENCISIPFEIPVMAYDFTNISSFTIQLTFDSTVLHFNSLTQVNKHLNDGSLEASLISPGILQITFTAADSVTLLSEDLLFNLNFNSLSTGNSVLQWDWLQCVIYSAYGYEIPAIYTKGAVDIRPAPQVYTEGAGAYCENTPLLLQAGSLTGSSLSYSWTSPGGIIHNGAKWNLGPLDMADNGAFRLVASDSTKCSKTETIQVQVNPNPVIQFAEYDTLCLEQVVVLNPGSAFVSYAWQDGSIAPLMESIYEGLYWVMVTDTNGCRSSDSVMLVPCDILRIDELEIWLPNAFSPNGDGINDVFGAKYDSEVKITFQMLVFNKWGQQIFSSGDVSKGWNGKFKGERCPPDLYTWVVTFGAPEPYHFSQKSPIRGHVMLLK